LDNAAETKPACDEFRGKKKCRGDLKITEVMIKTRTKKIRIPVLKPPSRFSFVTQ